MQYPVFKERSSAAIGQPPGNVLLSRPPSGQVPSALEGLTAVFGMGTGVSPPLSSPDILRSTATSTNVPHQLTRYQAVFFGRMVELNGIEPMTSCLQGRRSPN
jgi:hypothetical protein